MTRVDEILTPGVRLKSPGQVSPSLPLPAVGNLRLAPVSLHSLEKQSNVPAIVSCTAGARCAEPLSELSWQQYTRRTALQHPGGKINPEQLSQSILGQETFFNHGYTVRWSTRGFLQCSNIFNQENLTASCHIQHKYSSISVLKKITLRRVDDKHDGNTFFFLSPVANMTLWICYRAKALTWNQTLVTDLTDASHLAAQSISKMTELCCASWCGSASSSSNMFPSHQMRPKQNHQERACQKYKGLKVFQQVCLYQ